MSEIERVEAAPDVAASRKSVEKRRVPKPPRERGGWGSGFVGAVLEAWDELRVHRTRVLLSLIGVGVAVCALTSVVGIGAIAQQSQIEQMERGSGRPATLMIGAPYDPLSGEQADSATLDEAMATAIDRYKIEYAGSRGFAPVTVQFPDGAMAIDSQLVDVPFGVMHRIEVAEGAWFTERDEDRFAPAIIVNDSFWQRLGSPDLATHPTVTLLGERDVTAVIVGVTPPVLYEEGYFTMYLLNSAYAAIASPDALAQTYPQWELWVPPELADQLTELVRRDVTAAFGEEWQVDVTRNDYLSWEGGDPLGPIRMVLAGISVLILLLGALGLVNISLVTVRQRIREIGIRRAFGATARRVFFAVMMESVVATVVAGAVGVILAVFIVQNPMVRDFVAMGLSDVPPFPVEAAIIGLGAATAVGALAGLLPALVAVRVKVIDAIRY